MYAIKMLRKYRYRKFYNGGDDGILKISRQFVFFFPLYKGFRNGASRSKEETVSKENSTLCNEPIMIVIKTQVCLFMKRAQSLTLLGMEFQSRGTATAKEDEYGDVRWEVMDNIEGVVIVCLDYDVKILIINFFAKLSRVILITSKWADNSQATNFECTLTLCDLNCGFLLTNSDVYYANQDFRATHPYPYNRQMHIAEFKIIRSSGDTNEDVISRRNGPSVEATVIQQQMLRVWRYSSPDPRNSEDYRRGEKGMDEISGVGELRRWQADVYIRQQLFYRAVSNYKDIRFVASGAKSVWPLLKRAVTRDSLEPVPPLPRTSDISFAFRSLLVHPFTLRRNLISAACNLLLSRSLIIHDSLPYVKTDIELKSSCDSLCLSFPEDFTKSTIRNFREELRGRKHESWKTLSGRGKGVEMYSEQLLSESRTAVAAERTGTASSAKSIVYAELSITVLRVKQAKPFVVLSSFVFFRFEFSFCDYERRQDFQ
ncbi:hypothetical protein ANN_18184 [Periplaneta americana]|uniref:Uncharacterized protein n=1 Tax=Periplaneta americana TaxID=6978 RepID=A0ABQ8SN21_PERAM|nr:hypothetical protein ANN_18184 [Periplaneta americana]